MATSKFLRTFRTTVGTPITIATIWLVPQANTYPTGALALTAHSTRDGQYYRDNVPDGEYKIYIDPAGGSSPTLYDEHLWVGDQRITTISNNFDAADSYKLKPSGLKAQTKTVTSLTAPIPDYIGQMGVDVAGNSYVAISLTGTVWKNIDAGGLGEAHQLIRLHNPSLIFQGFVTPASTTPGIHTENNAWLVVESGNIFGKNAVRGHIIRDDGSNYLVEEIKSSFLINLLDATTIENGYINTSGVLYGTDPNWRRTDFIEVLQGQLINIKGYGHPSINSYSFYDNNKIFVSGEHVAVSLDLFSDTIVIPAGVSFIRFSFASEPYINFSLPTAIYYASFGEIKDTGATIKTILDFMEANALDYIHNLLYGEIFTPGYIGLTGSVASTDNHWRYTDYIYVFAGLSMSVKMLGHPSINSYSFYDNNKIFVSGEHVAVSLDLFSDTIVIPAGVSFIRFSFAEESFAISSGHPYFAEANIVSNVIDDIINLKLRLGSKQSLGYVSPHKIYTVCNNIIAAMKGNNRNYSAALYLDHLFNGLTEELDIKYKETGNDRCLFQSDIHIIDSSYNVVYNVDGSTVKAIDRSMKVVGDDIEDIDFTVKHISTLATAGKIAKPRILCIGDSITYGELAYFPGDLEVIQSYSLLTKQLFEMDKIDNGDVSGEYEALLLGIFKRSLNIDYLGINRTINACHQGVRGATLDDYITGLVPYFWDGSRFSLKPWVDLYRTMDDSGVRLTTGDPAIGTAVTNVNDYDVCVPTHVVIMLGTNGSETGAQYVTKIQGIISNIKLDCTTYGWSEIFVSIVLPDSAGTYFPSRHPNFDNSIAFWNDNGLQPTRHPRLFTYTKQWLEDVLSTDTEVADKVFMLPFWWTMPTAESACIREIPLPEHNKNYFFNEGKNYNKYGWAPTTHLNPNAHWSFAYQLYSWIKYTLTL